jgi:hypothetical protein
MRTERKLAAAAERQAGDRGGNRLSRRLQRAHGQTKMEEMIVRRIEACVLRRRRDRVRSRPDFRKVRPSAEAAVLARPDQRSARVARREPRGECAEIADRRVGEDVHRPPRRVKDQMDEAVVFDLDTELFKLRRGHGCFT